MRAGSKSRRATRAGAALVVLALSLAASQTARAAEPTEAELTLARDRFKEGVALEDAGDFRAARGKFELVAETRTSPQVLYHLAFCDENLGALVAAEAGYEKALADAQAAGSSAAGVVDTATTRLAALRSRIPTLEIVVEGGLAAGDVVTVDGTAREAWAEPSKIDPGRHVVTIERDGAAVTEAVVHVVEGKKATVRLSLAAPAPAAAPTPPPTADDAAGGGPPVAALVVGGVGVASLAVSGVTFAMSRVAIDDVRSTCSDPAAGTGCDPRSEAREADASMLTVTSGIFLGVGFACLVTGAVLWATLDDEPAAGTGKAPTARRRVELVPSSLASPLGLSARGRF